MDDDRERAEARLAEVRQVAVAFRNHHAGVLSPQAEALYHAVIQVIDRDKRSDEGAETSFPVAADPPRPEMPGQVPFPGLM